MNLVICPFVSFSIDRVQTPAIFRPKYCFGLNQRWTKGSLDSDSMILRWKSSQS
ncbi:MAG: hypothetical protein O3C32_04020 [Bacteroidetes bacterium]|nr:hypothetical protein [Bacteroidota bacterium]